MTHDELLLKIGSFMSVSVNELNQLVPNNPPAVALRAVVELAVKQLDIQDMPAEQVGWFYEGYRLAMDNVIEAIEKELN